MPYAQYSESALVVLFLASPILFGIWLSRSMLLRRRGVEQPGYVALLEVAFIGGIIGLIGVSLFGRIGPDRALDLNPFSGNLESTASRSQMIGNLLLPLPVGIIAAARWPRQRRLLTSAASGFGVLLALETMQFVMGGRVAALQDVLLGGTGWAIGSVLVSAFLRLRPAPAREADERGERAANPA